MRPISTGFKTGGTCRFQSTHSVGSATCNSIHTSTSSLVSIHALRGECDETHRGAGADIQGFNPRTPWGVRRIGKSQHEAHQKFQSTHSVGSATIALCDSDKDCGVSIHALRGECDRRSTTSAATSRCFNPRTPWGVRRCLPFAALVILLFQSTHSVGSATVQAIVGGTASNVSIHALRGECDLYTTPASLTRYVSIHALRGECDSSPAPSPKSWRVSIHALRGECDRSSAVRSFIWMPFQSTHSVGSATFISCVFWRVAGVSIHALRGECDRFSIHRRSLPMKFQSTHSVGSATEDQLRRRRHLHVSIHALRGECDTMTGRRITTR